jgi:hypothetical protein
VLTELRARRPDETVYVQWEEFESADNGLFLWEAFVTRGAKAASHVDDATVAVACFTAALPDPGSANAVTAERPLSLVGAAAVWSGWGRRAPVWSLRLRLRPT